MSNTAFKTKIETIITFGDDPGPVLGPYPYKENKLNNRIPVHSHPVSETLASVFAGLYSLSETEDGTVYYYGIRVEELLSEDRSRFYMVPGVLDRMANASHNIHLGLRFCEWRLSRYLLDSEGAVLSEIANTVTMVESCIPIAHTSDQPSGVTLRFNQPVKIITGSGECRLSQTDYIAARRILAETVYRKPENDNTTLVISATGEMSIAISCKAMECCSGDAEYRMFSYICKVDSFCADKVIEIIDKHLPDELDFICIEPPHNMDFDADKVTDHVLDKGVVVIQVYPVPVG